MSNKRQYDLKSMIEAIGRIGANVSAVAAEMHCSRSTIYSYRRKYPAVKNAWDAAGGVTVGDAHKQFPREKFEQAITESNGILQQVADSVGCSRQTVYNAFDEYPDLKALFEESRETLVDTAESVIFDMMVQRDDLKVTLNAATYITSRLGKKRGWTERSEVTGADGKDLIQLSPEVMELARLMNIQPSKVVAQFEKMIRAAAMAKGLVDG